MNTWKQGHCTALDDCKNARFWFFCCCDFRCCISFMSWRCLQLRQLTMSTNLDLLLNGPFNAKRNRERGVRKLLRVAIFGQNDVFLGVTYPDTGLDRSPCTSYISSCFSCFFCSAYTFYTAAWVYLFFSKWHDLDMDSMSLYFFPTLQVLRVLLSLWAMHLAEQLQRLLALALDQLWVSHNYWPNASEIYCRLINSIDCGHTGKIL